MKYTVVYINHALQSGHYVGEFNSLDEAQAFCDAKSKRVRSFVTYQPVEKGSEKRVGVERRGES